MKTLISVMDVIPMIKGKFLEQDGNATIPLLRGGHFIAKLVEGGIEVDNLGNQPFLPWCVFQEAVCILIRNGGTAKRGDAMTARLGDEALSLDSVEGHIALVLYGKEVGDSIFRRITPVASILEWAGLCGYEPGRLILL